MDININKINETDAYFDGSKVSETAYFGVGIGVFIIVCLIMQ